MPAASVPYLGKAVMRARGQFGNFGTEISQKPSFSFPERTAIN